MSRVLVTALSFIVLGATALAQDPAAAPAAPAEAAPAAGAGTPSANSLKDGMETTTAFMKAMAEGAPTELRPDFQTLAKFWSDYAAVMARNNYDFARVAMDADFQKVAAGSDGVDKASANIQAWVQKNCG